jgi:predicted ATPase/DNA-binding XRE family transcriptional regulator
MCKANNDEFAGLHRTLGPRLRSLRLACGISQVELARRARITQPRVCQIERGQTIGLLPLRTLCDLADGLGVDLDTLIGDDPRYEFLETGDERPLPRIGMPSARFAVRVVGREGDISEAISLLQTGTRLLTLIGPGGVGKTQLALHVARLLEPEFPGGVSFVSLALCVDPGCVIGTVAHELGLHERDGRPLRERLLRDLPRDPLLLLLDNVEQAASAVADLSDDLLAAYPQLSLLVTSRIPLHIRHEGKHPVWPLGLPDANQARTVEGIAAAAAVQLFVQRAREAVPSFALNEGTAAQIAAICARLDGLPLAIELAAPRIKVATPAQLLRHLDQRLTVLGNGPRDLPPRQRSLRACIEWSVALLDAPHQALLRRLSVFSGGFTLEAATDVAGEDAPPVQRASLPPSLAGYSHDDVTAERVSTLLDQHLLTRAEQHDGPRFGMLETVQAYAREQLELMGEAAERGARHLAWCLDLAEASVPKLFTAEEPEWLDRLQQDDANLQAALDRAFSSDQEIDREAGLRLAGALADYWYVSGQFSRGRAWLTRAVDLGANQAPSIGKARALVGACLIERAQAAVDPAEMHCDEGLALARKFNDQPTIGRALLLLGNLAILREEFDLARSLLKEAQAGFVQGEKRISTTLALVNLGMGHHRQGQLEAAAECAEGALAITREIGNRWGTIFALRLIGDIARDRGDLEMAKSFFAESLELSRQYGSERDTADSLSGLATVAVAVEDFEEAARLFGAADSLYRHLNISVPPPMRPDWTQSVNRMRDDLGPDRFARIWDAAPAEHATHEAARVCPFTA